MMQSASEPESTNSSSPDDTVDDIIYDKDIGCGMRFMSVAASQLFVPNPPAVTPSPACLYGTVIERANDDQRSDGSQRCTSMLAAAMATLTICAASYYTAGPTLFSRGKSIRMSMVLVSLTLFIEPLASFVTSFAMPPLGSSNGRMRTFKLCTAALAASIAGNLVYALSSAKSIWCVFVGRLLCGAALSISAASLTSSRRAIGYTHGVAALCIPCGAFAGSCAVLLLPSIPQKRKSFTSIRHPLMIKRGDRLYWHLLA